MSQTSITEYVEAAIDSPNNREQIKSAGNIIAHFLIVKKGLEGRVPADELNATAATLTAGIWSSAKA